MGCYRYDRATRRLTLNVHVQPNARRSGVVGVHGDALKIRVAAPAVDNKANAALIEFLGEWLGLPARSISIGRGAHGRRKLVQIDDAERALPILQRQLEPGGPRS